MSALKRATEKLIRFGPFELDVSSWELRRLGRHIKIRPQACKVLAFLAERSGQVVAREELYQHVWEGNTFVDFEHSLNFCIRQIRKALGERAESPLYLETVPRHGYRFNVVSAEEIHSLAVLPFENAGRDSELDYLVDGITESLIRQLAHLPRLQVIARTTVSRFKGRKLRPDLVGRRLGVSAVLTGRVVQRKGRLLIGVDLVDVSSGLHMWGAQYDQPSEDIVSVQQQISTEITGQLRLRVSGELRQQISNWGTRDVAAYHYYLRGRYFTNKSSGEGFRKGIEYFAKAIDQDPTYALAHAGLADSFGYLGFYGLIAPTESWLKARAAAAKAVEIDDSLAEGYAALGLVNLFYDWDPAAGLSKCRRAMELNPSYPSSYSHAAGCLVAMGLADEAAAMMEKAQLLDPLSVWVHTVAGLVAYLTRNYDRAIQELQKAIELDSRAGEARRALGITYIQMNDLTRAIPELEAARTLLGDTPAALGSLGRAYGRAGLVDKAAGLLLQLKTGNAQKRVAAASTAAIYVALGQNDLALDWLEKALMNRSSWLVWLNAEPWWDPLRHEPRFQTISDRIGPLRHTI